MYLKSTINNSRYLCEFDANNFIKKNTIINNFVRKNSIEGQKSRSRHSIAALPYNYGISSSDKNLNTNLFNLSQENNRISMENSLNLFNNYYDTNITSKRLYIKEKNNTYNGGGQMSSLKKLFKKKRLPISMFNNIND